MQRLALGRLPKKPGVVVPRMKAYQRADLPIAPAAFDWTRDGTLPVPFRMFLNDSLGDCTIAGIANGIVQRTFLTTRKPLVMPEFDVLAIYQQISGYRPGDPTTDRGCVETDVLNWFHLVGIDLGRGQPETGMYAALDHRDLDELHLMTWIFGSAYLGFELPNSIWSQGSIWHVPETGLIGDGAPGSAGGHCTLLAGREGNLWKLVTWGRTQYATTAFMQAYLDEAYVILSPQEWIGGVSGLSPNNFDLAALSRDIAAIH